MSKTSGLRPKEGTGVAGSQQKRKHGQIGLFDVTGGTGDWKPRSLSSLPNLVNVKEIWKDNETTGNKKFKDVPCGMAVATEDDCFYLPFGHLDGGNLDPEQVRRWWRDAAKGKRINNINTGFDAETDRNWGVDLEELGCTLHDISHAAALIDENRFKGPNLNELAAEFTPNGLRKIDNGVKPEDIHRVHSSLIGPYAENDVCMARDIDLAERPYIERDDLHKVMALEDELIWANNHMEREGLRLDVPKLTGWIEQSTMEYQGEMMRIWEDTFVKLKPNSASSWHELFMKLKLTTPEYTKNKWKNGKGFLPGTLTSTPEGYTEEFLKNHPHPLVKAGLRMRRLSSLQSKYLEKYNDARIGDYLGFHLYQLRASEDDFGTVVGRYSSANINVQQVFKVSNQIERFCDCGYVKGQSAHSPDCFGIRYIIRELMISEYGYDMFAIDGSQLQFREFAHYSSDPQLIAAYKNNPKVDFHQLVAELFHLTRQSAKHNNFAMVLGMGNEKLAHRLGLSCTCGIDWHKLKMQRRQENNWSDKSWLFAVNNNHDSKCPAIEANDLASSYNDQFPAAKKTMKKVSEVAENRGFIRSLLGRRRRFKDAEGNIINFKFYSGFASLLQMGEADLVKSKINSIYRNRKALEVRRLRVPVHDEVMGDISPDPVHKKRFMEFCNETVEIPLKVPMIWDGKFGKNWRTMKGL